MKKLLVIIILSLCFITSSKADDIRDFQIEGISTGDSALDFFSENEIKRNTRDAGYKKGMKAKFIQVENEKYPFFKTYDYVDYNYKTNDKKYIIHAIQGGIDYHGKPISECKKKLKEIFSELSSMFPNMNIVRIRTENSKPQSGRINTWGGFFSKNGNITLGCNEFTRGAQKNFLDVSIRSKEFHDFLRNAY